MKPNAIAAAILSGAAAILLYAIVLWAREDTPDQDGASHIVMLAEPPAAAEQKMRYSVPDYISGAEVPDGVRVDARGLLVVDTALLATFDYFLATSSDLPIDQEVELARRHLSSKLNGAALEHARDLLDRYAAYLKEVGALGRGSRGRQMEQGDRGAGGDIVAVQQKLAERRILREKHLGSDVARAWFGEQDYADEIALKRAALLASALSDHEKRERLALLDAQMPDADRRARDASARPGRIQETLTALRQSGASDAVLRQRLSAQLDPGATERLVAMTQRKAKWDSRYDAYAQARKQIEQKPGLSDGERTRQIERLRTASFPKEGEALLAQARDRTGT